MRSLRPTIPSASPCQFMNRESVAPLFAKLSQRTRGTLLRCLVDEPTSTTPHFTGWDLGTMKAWLAFCAVEDAPEEVRAVVRSTIELVSFETDAETTIGTDDERGLLLANVARFVVSQLLAHRMAA
jgi:hypothetical protein